MPTKQSNVNVIVPKRKPSKSQIVRAAAEHYEDLRHDLSLTPGEVKVQLGERLGMTRRHAGRYLLISKTPAVVQRAFDRGDLTLEMASQVGLLEPRSQKEIADAIRSGEKANKIAKEIVERDQGPKRRDIRKVLAEMIAKVVEIVERTKEIEWITDDDRATLEKALPALGDIMKLPDRTEYDRRRLEAIERYWAEKDAEKERLGKERSIPA